MAPGEFDALIDRVEAREIDPHAPRPAARAASRVTDAGVAGAGCRSRVRCAERPAVGMSTDMDASRRRFRRPCRFRIRPRPSSRFAMSITIGIIGGSGLYDMAELTDRHELTIDTPFGAPSGPYVTGTIAGTRVAFLARHGAGHRITPSELNFRANIYGFKTLGVERILSASAVGSLREDIAPLDLVIPDQFIDRTRGRVSTFFGDGVVGHIAFGDPICGHLAGVAHEAAVQAGARVHKGGTYVCMEGPAFSTRAESHLYRSWGAQIIGMTNLQEAKLAREAEICYATIALVTDYDCWHPDHDHVTVEMIIDHLTQNARTAQRVIAGAVATLAGTRRTCGCGHALATAIITRPDAVPEATRLKLAPIMGKYLEHLARPGVGTRAVGLPVSPGRRCLPVAGSPVPVPDPDS